MALFDSEILKKPINTRGKMTPKKTIEIDPDAFGTIN